MSKPTNGTEADFRAWANAALNLLQSATELWNARNRLIPPEGIGTLIIDGVEEIPNLQQAEIAAPSESSRWLPFNHAPTFLLLGGLSLELICKALFVQREAHRTGGAIGTLPRKYTQGPQSHDVTWLIEETGVELSDDDRELACRLQTYVTWAGRYPVPKPNQRIGDLVVREDDFERLNIIFGSIRARLNERPTFGEPQR